MPSCKHYDERFPESHPHNMAAETLAAALRIEEYAAKSLSLLEYLYSAAQSGHSGQPARSGAGRFDLGADNCPNGGCDGINTQTGGTEQ